MSDQSSLEDFIPLSRTVPLGGGRSVDIRPLTLRSFPSFTKAVQPILPYLLAGQIVVALTENPEALIDAVSIATGLALDDIPDDPAVFVELAGAVTEVNMDFFARRLLPALRAAGAAITAAVSAIPHPDGDSRLPGSASEATGLTTSSG